MPVQICKKGKCQRTKERRYVQLVKISSMVQKSSSASAVERPFQDVRSAVEQREKAFQKHVTPNEWDSFNGLQLAKLDSLAALGGGLGG